MFPREHGAYGQLLFPILTALAIGSPGAAALSVSAAALAAFVAHEPLLVLLGQRGIRATREQGGRARTWFAGSAALALVLGLIAVALMPPPIRWTIAVPLGAGAILAAWIVMKREHTTSGEIVSAVAMAALALPIATASGASMAAALTCVLAYASAFVVATVSVRAVILVTRRAAGTVTRLIAASVAVGLLAALGLLARAGLTRTVGAWAALPICAVGVWLVARVPSPRHLRTIGWTLVGATAVTAVVLVAGLR